MTLPLWSTAGGNEPFVYVFTMIAIAYGAILLANSNLINMIYGLYAAFMSRGKGEFPRQPAYVETLSALVLLGLSVALPAAATVLFYTERTAPYAATKNYRDNMWLSYLWMYASGAIFMASGIMGRKYASDALGIPRVFTERGLTSTGTAILQVFVYLVLFATIIVGMSLNVIEMQPQNLNFPEVGVFLTNGILLIIYMLVSFSMTSAGEKNLPNQLSKILETGEKLNFSTVPASEIKPGTLVCIEGVTPNTREEHRVASESEARMAFQAASIFRQTHPNDTRFNAGYQIRAILNSDKSTDFYMLPTESTQAFDTASNLGQSARAHINEDEFHPPVLILDQTPINSGVQTPGEIYSRLQRTSIDDFNATYAMDAYFFGVAPGDYFKMVIEEDVILLYVFYMLQIWLLTLRCSGTGLQLWTIVFLPPMFYTIAPRYRKLIRETKPLYDPTKIENIVDRRYQWAYVQMLWGAVTLSMIGLTYKVFPDLANNDFYITRVAIWQFASNNDNFWWTGDSGGFSYHTIHTVTILQLAIFSYFAFILLACFFRLGMMFYKICCKGKEVPE